VIREQLKVGMLVYIDTAGSTWATAMEALDYGQSSWVSPAEKWTRDVYLVVEPIYDKNPGLYVVAYKVLCGETYSYVHPYVKFKKAET